MFEKLRGIASSILDFDRDEDREREKNEKISILQTGLGAWEEVQKHKLPSDAQKATSGAFLPAKAFLSGAKIMNADNKTLETAKEASSYGCGIAGSKAGATVGGLPGAIGFGVASSLICSEGVDSASELGKEMGSPVIEHMRLSPADQMRGWGNLTGGKPPSFPPLIK